MYRYGETVAVRSANNHVKYAYNHKRKLKSVELNGEKDYVKYDYAETWDSCCCGKKETVTAAYASNDTFVAEKDGKGNLLKLTVNNVVQLENTYKNGALDTLKDKITGKNYKFEREEKLDSLTSVYEVDENGMQVSNGFGEAYDYDAYGKLAKKTIVGPVSQVYEYTYADTATHALKSICTPIATEEYEYDCLDRNKKITQTFGGNTLGKRFTYKKVGAHATNQINGIAYLKNGVTDGKVSYTYDNMGNILSVSENGKQTRKYTYDALNRVIKENVLDKEKEICYTYDNNGNILTKSVNGETIAYKYKEDSDQLVAFGDETFIYDKFGNPTTFRGMTAKWTNGKQLKLLNDGTNTVEYTYNGKGLRKTKKVGGVTVTYTYDSNDKLIKEVGEKTIEYVYGAEGITGITIGGTPYLFRKNVFGDVTHIYSEDGELVGKYSYTAFGECEIDLNVDGVASDNPIRYRSYYYDEETNLYYLNTRYYDPAIGRFMTIDSIAYLAPDVINGLNLYAYCNNNPVMCVDPTGHFPLAILAAALLLTPLGGMALQGIASVVGYAGMAVASIFDEDVRNDMNAIGWNPFNSDESLVLGSNKVSFYKGVPVIRTNIERSGSFGAIFLRRGYHDFYGTYHVLTDTDEVRHERGHNSQLMMMGIGIYGFTVGIPSPAKLGKWDKAGNYYGAPWETMADILGGVKGRTHSKAEKWNAWEYYAVSIIAFPFTALYWF